MGIGSLFLNLLSCKSVSTCRFLPALPALLFPPDISCSKSIAAPGSACSISLNMLCMLLCTASALLPACYVQILHAALHCFCSFACVLCADSACCSSYLCKARLCGSMLIEPTSSEFYRTGASWQLLDMPGLSANSR